MVAGGHAMEVTYGNDAFLRILPEGSGQGEIPVIVYITETPGLLLRHPPQYMMEAKVETVTAQTGEESYDTLLVLREDGTKMEGGTVPQYDRSLVLFQTGKIEDHRKHPVL